MPTAIPDCMGCRSTMAPPASRALGTTTRSTKPTMKQTRRRVVLMGANMEQAR